MEDALFKSQIKKLKESFRNGEKFVLFVGAGQNAGANVRLLWGDLIREVSRIAFNNFFHELNARPDDIHAIMEAMGIRNKKSKEGECAIIQDSDLTKFINTHFPVEVQVSMIKNLLKDQYIPELQKQLYDECNYRVIKEIFSKIYAVKGGNPANYKHPHDKNPNEGKDLYTLFVIARMILLNPQIESVITYNFDNFIRQAVRVLLKYRKDYFSETEQKFLEQRYALFVKDGKDLSDCINVVDVHDNEYNSEWRIPVGAFPVYHVHGYIPDPTEEEIVHTPNIVMALEEFVEQQTDGLSWQDAVQIKAFRDSNIIFIGCSMTDLTMKRMLNFAHTSDYHNNIYILDASHNSDESDKQANNELSRRKSILNQLRRRYFESLGATFIYCQDGFNALCDTLHDITYSNLNK